MKRLLILLVGLTLLVGVGAAYAQDATEEPGADLDAIKAYLLENVDELKTSSDALKVATQAYFDLAEAGNFDYVALWKDQPEAVAEALAAAKDAWIVASPLYEKVEGVVAGVPSLSEFDVILDAGSSAEEDPENAVPFDLTLEDGRVLKQPGNLFGVLEGTLWGTKGDYSTITADLDGDGELEFGETLPDANVAKAGADALDSYVTDLVTASEAWEPTESDAFTALVVMVPTMSEYFGSWKESRFIAGDAATRTDFAVISRLSDIQDILSGLEVVYAGVSPLVATVGTEQDAQIGQALTDLKAYVSDLFQQENDGRKFTAEEADFFGSEAQDRAQAIAGQITQVAALLGIELAE